MLIAIPDLLPGDAALALGATLAAAGDWADGNATSGAQAARAKHNRQLPEGGAALAEARAIVQRALATNALFLSAALPRRIVPPLVNRYGVGDQFAPHVDNAIRIDPHSGEQLRTDLSATLFLSDPDAYDGGALTIAGSFGEVAYRLPAGHLLLYPATSLHHVTPVTRGQRLGCFFWVQSMVRDGDARAALFELDQSVQALSADRGPTDHEVLRLTNLYHNLVRRWAV